MAVMGSQDKGGRLWASLLFGKPGFLEPASDGRSLRILLSKVVRQPFDPLWRNIANNPRVGMLVIDLGSRRRLRSNGRASSMNSEEILLEIDEAYPNCLKYIQWRHVRQFFDVSPLATGYEREGAALDTELTTLIHSADAVFLAA